MLNKCQKRIKMESKWWTICITSFKIYWKYRDKKLGTWKYRNQNETKATLSDLPTCYMSLYRMPSTVVNTTEKLYRNFLWKGGSLQGSHLVWWDKVIKTHAQGGLGLQSLIDKTVLFLLNGFGDTVMRMGHYGNRLSMLNIRWFFLSHGPTPTSLINQRPLEFHLGAHESHKRKSYY